MTRVCLTVTALSVTALLAVTIVPSSAILLWNATESASKGLYWQSDRPLTRSGWAVVGGHAPSVRWVAERGYLARDWPIIKRVRGLPGDEICRWGATIWINGRPVATALHVDGSGRILPRWAGCFVLTADQLFLLNDHPRSLDGRYFGPTPRSDVTGAARLLLRVE